MFVTVILLIVGMGLVVAGADALVDGASSIARKFSVSSFVIGITIVAIGTSLPELVVSLTGSIEGHNDVAIGNVIGSNIFNMAIILGITALVRPVIVYRNNVTKDMVWNIVSSVLVIVPGLLLGTLSRWCGAVYLILFLLYILQSFHKQDKDPEDDAPGNINILKSIILVIAGIAGLVFGGRLFVDKAVVLAQAIGMSEKFIAITILAAGTSLPELATSIVAAAKGETQLALGNVVGSNIANVFLILGVSALVNPIAMTNISAIDYIAFMTSPVLILLFALWGRGNKIDRFEGSFLVLSGIIYMVFLTLGGGN